MHEYALAEAVAAAALNVADERSLSRITRIEVRIGELQSISTELMRSAFEDVLPAGEPRLQGVRLDLEIEPARLTCRACSRAFGFADASGLLDRDAREAVHFVPELAHAFAACPDCGSADFEVTEGRGVVIGALEGEA